MGVGVTPTTDSIPLSVLPDYSQIASLPVISNTGNKRRLSEDHLSYPRPTKFVRMSEQAGPEHSTGIVYDPRMRLHYQNKYMKDFTLESPPDTDLGVHPEDPRRIAKIMRALEAEDLVHRDGSSKPATQYPRRINARDASDEELARVHSQDHLAEVANLKTLTNTELEQYENGDLHCSLYACNTTEQAAKLAAGGTIDLCKAIMRGELKNGFAVVRPPGHHAEPQGPRGFCWYNNVSIAAKALLADPELECTKILVIDWDIHHGNGIQAAHYDSDDVLYISLHRNDFNFYPKGTSWPKNETRIDVERDNESYGNRSKLGVDKGLGYNINIPWSQGGMGDGDYIYAFDQVVLPIAREYQPDIIIVASGFDAAAGDTLGRCHVSDGCYAYLTHALMGVCSKVAVVLEGGYNMLSISLSAVGVVKALLGRELPRMANSLPSVYGVYDVDNVVSILQSRTHWQTVKVRVQNQTSPMIPVGVREVIRQWEIAQLWDRYNLFPLFVEAENINKLYHNCVLANPGFGNRANPLLLIIHETNEPWVGARQITGEGHPVRERDDFWLDGKISEALADANRRYIESSGSYIGDALKLGFDVIDIHLPIVNMAHDPPTGETPIAAATKLLTYVMEHYVKPSDVSDIYLMATGIGHDAVTDWIMANEIYAMENITRTISFLTEGDPKRVRSSTTDGLSRWYYKTSQVFVKSEALAQAYMGTTDGGKPKQRIGFGSIIGSLNMEDASMWDLLRHHRPDVMRVLDDCPRLPPKTPVLHDEDDMEI
ncbi:hypothetical protein AMS68_007946 [Peltaster fructicola]|uniref:histone deacetylase n=1 Tax=Peltaster fructicola TaxID=286661 RepID=A0A6H0Y6H6_9PEZI|nr:hypothetical protein AMS68_007946 [Peltaster fructicola]